MSDFWDETDCSSPTAKHMKEKTSLSGFTLASVKPVVSVVTGFLEIKQSAVSRVSNNTPDFLDL